MKLMKKCAEMILLQAIVSSGDLASVVACTLGKYNWYSVREA